jgi:hypothetical protein
MNTICWDQVIEVLPHIATWVTVVLVIFTLIEMAKQRKSTYKPDIVVSKSFIYAYLGHSKLPNRWLDHKPEDNEIDIDEVSYKGYFMRAHNLGLGAARDVEFVWNFDRNKIIQKIESISQTYPDQIRISLNERGFLEIDIDKSIGMWINLKRDLEHSTDYILPASIDNAGYKLRFPSTYSDLVSILLMVESHRIRNSENGEKGEIFAIEFPSLDLKIEYRDIGGSKHSKNLEFSFSISQMALGDLLVGDCMFAASLEQM